MDDKELWKPVVGFEDLYEVSNLGRVRSMPKMCKNNYFRDKKHIMSLYKNKNGYMTIRLNKDDNRYSCIVHRLVAEAFIPNIDNLPEINHKDENKTNNKVDNLEWCSRKYNANYGLSSKINGMKHQKKIEMLDLNNNVIKQFISLSEASLITKISISSISLCCNNKQNKAGGYKWRYVNE